VMGAAGLGRSAGATAGGLVWQQAGMVGIGLLSAGLTLIGLLFLILGLRGWSAKTASDLP